MNILKHGVSLKILFGSVLIVIVAVMYLTVPSQWLVSSTADSKFLAADQPIPLVVNDKNNGKRCESNKVYVTERTREMHENEGYAFIVDDNCANLQKQLVDSIANENLDEVRRLISLGANPATSDWSQFEAVRPVLVAAGLKTLVLKTLLDNGADVNEEYCCCMQCNSPLTKAIENDQIESVKLLLQRGADVNYRPSMGDDEHSSAFDLGMRSGNPQIIQLLVEHGCEPDLKCRVKSRANKVLRVFRDA